MPKKTITIEIEAKNAIEAGSIEKALNKLSELPAEDRNRICQLIESPKALKALKDKWTMLKLMFT